MELKVIKDDDMAEMICEAKVRAVYAGPGVTDTAAAALIEVRKRLDKGASDARKAPTDLPLRQVVPQSEHPKAADA